MSQLASPAKAGGKSSPAVKQPPAAAAKSQQTPQVEVYYDAEKKTFWALNGKQEWQELTKGSLSLILRSRRYATNKGADELLSEIEEKYLDVIQNNSVHYAGVIAGWKAGLHDICGNRNLITRGVQLPTPKRGPFPLIKQLIADLLGDQGKYFYGWIKHAVESLERGSPFAPGQMLAIAGPVKCGKSVLQNLITEMLGGRMAKPHRYMTGDTAFNGDLAEAEHLMIEDDAEGTDIRTRRHFGASIKTCVVNKTQSVHPKGRKAFTSQPFWRLTMTLNDTPERLKLLPPLDADIEDKILLLKANQVKFPYPSKTMEDFHAYWDALLKEIPAYMHAIRRWEIPAKIRCERFGVKTYHDPDFVDDLLMLSPEGKLWSLICDTGIAPASGIPFKGTATEIEATLRERDSSGQTATLLEYSSACGQYLARLEKGMPNCVSSESGGGNRKIYSLTRPKS